MSIAAAIRKNAEPLAQAQTTYKENVVIVNTFVNGVLTSKLPTLAQSPPDWQQFITAYEEASSGALDWVNKVMARLLDVPGDVDNYYPSISQLLGNAKEQAEALVADPSNQAALSALQRDLNQLPKELGLVTSFISGAAKAVQEFSDALPTLSAKLEEIASRSAQDAKADEAQIQRLNNDISQLQDDIKALTGALIGLGIADGIALTLGIVSTIAFWPVGALAWFALGPVVVVATTYIALDAEKIKADKAKVDQDKEEISGLTESVAALKILAQSYQAMVGETEAIESSLTAILQAWQGLEGEAVKAVEEIGKASGDTTSQAFEKVREDLDEAIKEWDAAHSLAHGLAVELNVNNAELDAGMSRAQTEEALSKGTTLGIIEYYNEVGNDLGLAPAAG